MNKQITFLLTETEQQFLRSLAVKKDDRRVTTGYSIAIHKLIADAMTARQRALIGQALEELAEVEPA